MWVRYRLFVRIDGKTHKGDVLEVLATETAGSQGLPFSFSSVR